MWELWGGAEPPESWLKWAVAAAAVTSAVILLAVAVSVVPFVWDMLKFLALAD
ncbi:hypothetical protein GCM10010399_43570 [Dactylosporangium fulvum]|uniref:Uncharacterized protein n=1 Tax=Dactylosporangium fulvum TaxID=53359 RepID=A0ABY5W7G6_9ACTN|nr:hypothetical protein [Dactylosporangium fulvum]UWP85975.1 hypothetical protein Dfulv_17655 [Dactylosporangium fulvum]